MASSGSFKSDTGVLLNIEAVWTVSQSVSGNYSTVTVDAILHHNSLECAALSGSYIKIGAGTYSFSKAVYWDGGNTTTKLASYSANIYHNSDGTKSVDIAVGWEFKGTYSGVSFDVVSASQTVTLPTIPRASSPTVSGSMKDGLTVNITASASTFNHQVGITVGNYTKYFGITKNHEKSINISAANLVQFAQYFSKTSKTATATITLHTYTGTVSNTWIASKTTTYDLTIPDTDEYKPTFTIKLEKYSWLSSITTGEAEVSDGEELYTNVTGIRAYAKDPTAKHGSYIDKCEVTFGHGSNNPYVVSDNTDSPKQYYCLHSGTWRRAGEYKIRVVVTDSRGLSTEFVKTVKFVEHQRPSFLGIDHKRKNIDGDLDKDNLVINPRVSYDSAVGDAFITCSYKLHYGGGDIESGVSLDPNTENTTDIKLRKTSSYDFTFTITDGLGDSVSYTMLIPTAQVDFHLNDGKARFGGYAEGFDGLECDWNAKFNKTVYIGDITLEQYIKNIISGG